MPIKLIRNTVTIKDMLHARIGHFGKSRSKREIHASDLTNEYRDYCPREVRLTELLGRRIPKEHIDVSQQTTYDEGHDKQARFNNDWMRDCMVGTWRCESCGSESDPCIKTPRGGCDDHDRICKWVYKEPFVYIPEAGVGGALDSLVDMGRAKLRFVEVKIMAAPDWKKLKMPLSEHATRTKLYLYMIKNTPDKWARGVETRFGTVVYICRGWGGKGDNGVMSPFKEFTVKADHEASKDYVSKGMALHVSRQDKDIGLPCGICPNGMADRAQFCPVKKECFSRKYPKAITWLQDGKPVHRKARFVATGDDLKGAHIAHMTLKDEGW